jgi:hypothetical protein
MRVEKLTRLTGSTADKFPQVAWVNGNRNKIASIEKNLRAQVIALCGIELGSVEDMSAAGHDVTLYAVIDQRTLTGRQATETEIANNASIPVGTVGSIFIPIGGTTALIMVPEYQQDVVLKVSDSEAGLADICSGIEEKDALTAFVNANDSLVDIMINANVTNEKRLKARAAAQLLTKKASALKDSVVTGALEIVEN